MFIISVFILGSNQGKKDLVETIGLELGQLESEYSIWK